MSSAGADFGAVFDAHLPALTGGYGREDLTAFYRDHFVGKWPADTVTEEVSRTIGDHRLVDEMILRFTHDIEMDGILLGVAPTGRSVEMALAVVVDFEDGKISAERISWVR